MIYKFVIMLTLQRTFEAYHRDWGPILAPFTQGYVSIAQECKEEDGKVCLELPTKKICKEKTKPLNPWLPIPWWYFFCQMLLAPKTAPKLTTKSYTIHPSFRKTLDDLIKYKKEMRYKKLTYL